MSTGRAQRVFLLLALFLTAPLTVGLCLSFAPDPEAIAASKPLIHREEGNVGSETCRPCHLEQHASWSKTYHRTMTQRAETETVVGAFDGRTVRYMGKEARPFQRDGRFYMTIPADEGTREAEVVLAVGSRRYQQYFEQVPVAEGHIYQRLPILWHIGWERWLHMNTVFLGPDDADWDAHATRWNDNCIFCHNTAPRPGIEKGYSFDSHVAELGIACESCHGPGEAHVAAQRNPGTRYGYHLSGEVADDIVNPERQDQAEAVSACGQCHGQRVPIEDEMIVDWMHTGPTYRSGDDLLDHVKPVTRDLPPPRTARHDLFSQRFWSDGTPRLSAYEFQGVIESPCYKQGPMTCGWCHSMHGGDPKGMIYESMRGNRACVQCHQDIGADVAGHTMHAVDSSGSQCLDCHMPKIVYGILETHRSHLIEVPDPARDAEQGRPNACTMCHLNRSPLWAADEMKRLWGDAYRRPSFRQDKAPLEMSDAVASLLAGDPVQRAVYASAAGRAGRTLEDPGQIHATLAVTLGDGWPSVRSFAQRSLETYDDLPAELRATVGEWDHTLAEERGAMARAILDYLSRQGVSEVPTYLTDDQRLLALLELQEGRIISIGE